MINKIEKFEDLDVWQNAVNLSVKIYDIFKDNRDFGFRDQICRASVSIASNIAEGFERQYNKEFIHFLFIARGSAGELRTQIEIGNRLQYFIEPDYNSLIDDSRKTSAQLYKLIQVRKERFK